MASLSHAAAYAAAVQARLVPGRAPGGELDRVEQTIAQGLPHRFALDGELEVILMLPTGLAAEWLDPPPEEVVSTSSRQRAPYGAPGPATPPARLIVRLGGVTLGVLPLVAGARRLVSGSAGRVRAEIEVVDWDLRAAAVRGPGDTASRLVIAWRRADQAPDRYPAPPAPRRVMSRLPITFRMESEVGLRNRTIMDTWTRTRLGTAVRR
ncbi:hypothetical protein [Nonomuraea sp. NPDC003201]